MLAAMSSPPQDAPPQYRVTDSYDYAEPEPTMEDRLCPGCKMSAVNENGGLVVAFGQSFFHVDCFKCAKCGDKVTADTNLLLLSDGSPICANCSYSCNVCNLPILDEAIMTGDDSYHAHCFKCKVCKTRIDELVFAKTSQGIYCMNCHNDRMAKIRRHAQKKREKEKAGGSTKSLSRLGTSAGEYGTHSPQQDSPFSTDLAQRSQTSVPAIHNGRTRPFTASSHGNDLGGGHPPRPPAKTNSAPLVSDAFEPNTKLPTPSAISITPESPPRGHKPHKQLSVTVLPSETNGDYMLSSTPSPTYNRFQDQSGASTTTKEPSTSSSATADYLLPNGNSLQHKKSYDDGMRPLDVLFGNKSRPKADGPPQPHNTGNDSSKPLNERQSVQIDTFSHSSPYAASSAYSQLLSPHALSESPMSASPSRTSGPVTIPSPILLSPQTNTLRHSASTEFLSATSSPLPPDKDLQEEQSADRSTLKPRPGSSSIYLPEDQQLEDSGPSMGPSVTLDQVPSRTEIPSVRDQLRLSADVGPGRSSPTYERSDNHSVRSRKSWDDGVGFKEHRLSSNSSSRGSRPASGSRSRPTSDSRRADVPHSIESGTDTEGEREESERQSDESVDAHLVPSKSSEEAKAKSEELDLCEDNEGGVGSAPGMSKNMQVDNLDDLEESEVPVESTSVATFIAPALPPIRFSLTSADFSEMLKNVGGMPTLKALDQLAKLAEEGDGIPTTPLPTAALPLTPYSDATVTDDAVRSLPVPRNKTLRKLPPTGRLEGRPSTESTRAPPTAFGQSRRHDSEGSRGQSSNLAHHGWPSTSSASHTAASDSSGARQSTTESSDLVVHRLQEAYADATERGAQQLKLDKAFVEAILTAFEQREKALDQLKVKYDGAKRASQHYVDGLTVASTEYDQELKARRDAEAEVTRLRVLLSGQAVRLTTISGEVKKQELRQQMSQELSDNLDELEGNLSKLKVERDMALAEVEELSASKSAPVHANGEVPAAKLGRSLTMRLDNIKTQYQHELVPLTRQRDALNREILDLKATRDMFLEETTALNARNEELAQLSAQYARRMDSSNIPDAPPTYRHEHHPPPHERQSSSFDRNRTQQSGQAPGVQPSFSTSTASSTTLSDESSGAHSRNHKTPPDMGSPMSRPGKFKWKGSKARDPSLTTFADHKPTGRIEHTFQQLSVLRLTRCDHCGDKMWGSQLRCTGCNISVHVRCINHVQPACSNHPQSHREPQASLVPLPPSMFGRDLGEQIRADAKGGDRQVPVIVEKCIDAVDTLALDYEGIYRKNGGSGQSKTITQLFERGDYRSFDLRDQEQFNDICSVTSVLKTYFRSLPVPLLTYDLHDEFMSAAAVKDPDAKYEALLGAVNKLPNEHYYTLRSLMLHLHNVRQHSEVNLMTARNLGVVFGPTLMRSPDPSAEFNDMAGKAISVEWLVDNAPAVFASPVPSH